MRKNTEAYPDWSSTTIGLTVYIVSASVFLGKAKPIEGNPDFNTISAKPGEYEVKVLRNGRLSRSIKFTVGSDGRAVDNGTGASIGQPLVGIVPVAFFDDQDGPWDKSAWKTEALYGNPLANFTWPPQ